MRVTILCIMAAIYLAWPNYALGQVNPDLEALPAAVKKVDLTGHFFGKVIDAVTGKGIESATIQLLHVNDTVIKNIAASLLATVITNRQGEFNIESIPVLITYQLRIYSLGYAPYRHIISFKSGFISLENGLEEPEADAHFKDLGNIKIFADSSQLDNITLNADRPLYEIKFDRKIYNVEKDLSVTGGTAADVLKNIPSVSVDGNGNPTLRNASPQIFIDGRPTTLSLDQVPADQVASVEIMTNPSARYDADGGGGIINIILKKNRKPGYNGSVRASIDKRGMPGVGGDINMRQGKVNLFASGYGGYRKSLAEATTTRRDSIKDKIAFLTQNNAPQTQGTIVYGRAGMDYFADNRNTFSLTGNLVRGKFRNRDYLYTSRDTTFPTFTSHETSERDLRSITYFTNSGFVTGYRHNFSRPNRDITADVTYNQTNNTNTSDYQSYYFDMAGIALPPVGAERATGGGKTKFLTIQSDYATPFSKNKRLETGLRMSRRNFISYNDNFIQDLTSRRYVYIPAIAVAYNFNDQVYAAYANYAQQFKTFSLQAGLRVENSRYDGRLVSGKSFSNSYPFSLFPSLYLSKKLSEHQNLQLNYSRKINRPGFFQIIPFIDFSDSLNLTIGFPGLKPEFIHLGELSYVYQNLQGNTFQGTIYGKRSDDIILRYQYRAANPNPAKLDSVIFNSYANARESNTMGIELTNRTKVMNWWDLTTSFNLYHIDVNADNLAGAGNTTLTSYFGKIASTFRLGNNFTLQLNSEYQAKTILPVNAGRNATTASYGGSIFGSSQVSAQGYIKPLFSTDISLKKEFGKNNAAALTLQFNDVLRTRLYSTHANGSYFSQDYSRRRDPQYARLNFNYRFGKPDGSIFKRRNQRADMEPVQGIPQ